MLASAAPGAAAVVEQVVGAGVVPDVQVMHTACVPMMPLLHALHLVVVAQ